MLSEGQSASGQCANGALRLREQIEASKASMQASSQPWRVKKASASG